MTPEKRTLVSGPHTRTMVGRSSGIASTVASGVERRSEEQPRGKAGRSPSSSAWMRALRSIIEVPPGRPAFERATGQGEKPAPTGPRPSVVRSNRSDGVAMTPTVLARAGGIGDARGQAGAGLARGLDSVLGSARSEGAPGGRGQRG